ncbi:MAG: cysteine synthase A [Pseudomonadota bacterium]
MKNYFNDNAGAVGLTPLVRLNKICGDAKSLVLAKIEGRNPAYSIKDRIGVYMIRDAEEKGLLRKGMEIVEPTSGNTGIALAYVCALKGYSLTLTMPETMSVERRMVLKMFGAKIRITDGAKGMKGAVQAAEDIVAGDPGHYHMPQQFKNPANIRAHYETTGPEIWEGTDGEIDVLVSGVGTGGTITGIAHYMNEVRGKKIVSVAVEPVESPVITQTLHGRELIPGPHKIQGIGAGFIPDVLDLSVIDEVEQVSSDEAVAFSRRLAREEGMLSGISSGAAACAATRLVKREEYRNKTIVVILPSAGERYLSSVLFEGLKD